jgi:ABC-type transport system substrate-binding protein
MTSGVDRRRFALGGAALLGAARAGPAGAGTNETPLDTNVLRVLFESAETGFDPARTSDLYSSRVESHIFEPLLSYDPLAIPVRVVPCTADALPEASADFRTWTVRVRPGIYFTDDPAFRGQRRELVAADYVYSFKRIYDPATRSPAYSSLQEDGIVGLEALRERALRDRTPFDYRSEVEGIRALDRYTLQFKLAAARPRFLTTMTANSYAAVAREVIEAYGDDSASHPVGTGPYRLKDWRRSSRIVLERNPVYRDVRYHSEPAPDDADAQAWAKRLNGRRLPLNDGVEISIVEENQPRWLSFLLGQADFARVPPELSIIAAPNGKLAPNLARQGLRLQRYVNSDIAYSYFNMEDPVVGGYAPAKVALRRAVSLAYDIDKEIRIIRRGQAIAAQGPMAPGCYGYDAAFRTENSSYDPSRAKALLDIYGYVDRNGDGWREQPDGAPLVLTMGTEPEQIYRQYNENWQKSMAEIGIRMRFDTAQWSEHNKAAHAGKLQMWFLAGTATDPDAQGQLENMYGPSAGQGNLARFKLPAFDAIYRHMLDLPDGPERLELFKRATEIGVAYMPYRIHVHRIYNDFSRPWITGYRQPFFRQQCWHFVEVDGERRARELA